MNGMPKISKCTVTNCFYNNNSECHAPAITVGSDHPACDAFVADQSHIHRKDIGLVGACHVTECRFNQEKTCQAQGITVSSHSNHADCSTFAKKA